MQKIIECELKDLISESDVEQKFVLPLVINKAPLGLEYGSNYGSVEECKRAIDRYFDDRNQHFKKNPKRAGNKIWGKSEIRQFLTSRRTLRTLCGDNRLIKMN